jgi:type I restriction enzyme S subunit
MNYGTYKSSENEWIGEIPSHWSIIKLKFAALVQPSNVDKKQSEGEAQVLLCNYVDVYKNEFIDETIKFMEATASENEIQKFKIQEGDVLITKDSETPDDIAIPAFVSKDLGNVLCGYHLALLRSQKDILKGFYLYYLFKSYRFNQQFTIAANGITRFGLSADDVRNAFISIPPIAEQSIIANFLYLKTRQIDDLVAKKLKLIELMIEERTALINCTVTKGLDPTVSMKDSGIEWLGEIPKHWKLTNIKKITTKIGSGVTPKGGADVYVETGIPFFRSQNIHFSGIRTDEIVFIPIDVHEKMSASKMNKDDVLLNITGASIGRCCVYEGQLGDIEERSYKEIELISEYKTSLINEAMTGKIDVRDYKINHA